MRPGPNVTVTTAVPPSTPPTNTGTWFAVGQSQAGTLTPTLLTSFAQFQKLFGTRTASSQTVYDAVEQYFLEGGARLVFGRSLGAAAVAAKVELENAGKTKKVLKVEANGPGVWANTYKVTVALEGSSFTITTKNGSGEVLEVSPLLASNAEAASWSKKSAYLTITSLETEAPGAGTFELVGGTDVTPVIGDYETSLKKFTAEFGPGQVSIPGVTTTAILEAVVKISNEQNRCAILDLPRTATKAELVTAAEAIRNLGTAARKSILWADWIEESPVAGTVAPRFVAPSAYVAAKAAQIDALGNPNIPIAGKLAILSALGKSSTYTEVEMEELRNKGVNLAKVVAGQVRLYGLVTPVNQTTESLYAQWNNSRLDMAILWKGLAIEESFVFSQIDGEGKDAAAYGNALKGMFLELYKAGAVFGETPSQAFAVDVLSVNTPATAAEGNLNATVAYRRSPGAEMVNLNLTRVPITQEV